MSMEFLAPDFKVSRKSVNRTLIHRLRQETEFIENENLVLENFLRRSEEARNQRIVERFHYPQPEGESSDAPTAKSVAEFEGESTFSSAPPPKREKPKFLITMQRINLAKSEAKYVDASVRKLLKRREVILMMLDTKLEESRWSIGEVRKSLQNLEDFLKTIINPSNSKYRAEKMVNYFRTRLRKRDNLEEDLRMSALHHSMARRSIYQNITDKREICENLKAVDLLHYATQNKEHFNKIEEQTKRFLHLKEKDVEQTRIVKNLKKQIEDHLATLENTSKTYEYQEKFSLSLTQQIQNQGEGIRLDQEMVADMEEWKGRKIPNIKEYIGMNRLLKYLEKALVSWQTKVATMQRLRSIKTRETK